ncbi:hypothetical protein ATER59S_05321 [Aquamicrobium terrae]
MFWTAEADTSTVMLTHAPDILPAAGNLFSELRETAARSDEQGVHFLMGSGPRHTAGPAGRRSERSSPRRERAA